MQLLSLGSGLQICGVVVEGFSVTASGVNGYATTPSVQRLIIDQNLGLRKECPEAVGDTQLFRALAGVSASSAAPAIEFGALLMQRPNVLHNRWHRDPLRTGRPKEGVVYVDVDDHWKLRLPLLGFLNPGLRPQEISEQGEPHQ